MVLRNSLLRADVAEHIQLLLIFSAHTFFYQVALWKQESLLVLRGFPEHPAGERRSNAVQFALCQTEQSKFTTPNLNR